MGNTNVGNTAEAVRARAALRAMTLAAGVLVLIQVAIGMVVNLYVTVPAHHPGSRPDNYFSGSARSVAWAMAHGPVSLVVHATLGLALAIIAIALAGRSLSLRAGWVAVTSTCAAAMIIGAGFNGASFLDFNGRNISSLLMSLLALGALTCYLVASADRTTLEAHGCRFPCNWVAMTRRVALSLGAGQAPRAGQGPR
ncbi:MAG: hypothetical protein ACR2NR_01920 [Solirubrobacteraceae bacterium]